MMKTPALSLLPTDIQEFMDTSDATSDNQTRSERDDARNGIVLNNLRTVHNFYLKWRFDSYNYVELTEMGYLKE